MNFGNMPPMDNMEGIMTVTALVETCLWDTFYSILSATLCEVWGTKRSDYQRKMSDTYL